MYYVFESTTIRGHLDDILKFNAYRHSHRMILAAVQVIEYAVKLDLPNLKRIAHNAYQNYLDAQMLLKDFVIREINPYFCGDGPEDKWFDVSFEEMLEMLNDETKKILKEKDLSL